MSRDRTRTRERTEKGSVTGRDDANAAPARSKLGTDDEVRAAEGSGSNGGRLARVRSRAHRVFAPRAFLAALLAAGVCLVVGNAVVPLPGAGLIGVFLGTFLVGLVGERRHYLESSVAGGLAFGVAALLQYAVIAALGGLGLPLAAVAGGVGAVVGGVGHYFGRDLRDGLTREL